MARVSTVSTVNLAKLLAYFSKILKTARRQMTARPGPRQATASGRAHLYKGQSPSSFLYIIRILSLYMN